MLAKSKARPPGRLGCFVAGFSTGLLFSFLPLATPAIAADTNALPSPVKVAVFVDNQAGAEFDDKVPLLEHSLASRIASQQMQVLSRETILNSLKDFSAGSTSKADTPGQKLDRALSDSASALRLAQNLGADYVLVPTIVSYGKESRTFNSNGIKTVNNTHILRVTYRLAEAARGGEVAGDSVTVSRTFRQTAGLQVESTDVTNQLIEEAADKLAATLRSRQETLAAVSKDSKHVSVTIQCIVTDFASLPNAGLNEKNEVVIGTGHAQTFALDVNAEVNGITVGTAPGTFEVPAGLNKLRLTRDGFKPYERTVNFYDGQTLTVALQMTEAGFARWKDVVASLTALENNRKLTDAQVEVLRGYAQMLRQSGFKVDTKEGMKFYREFYR